MKKLEEHHWVGSNKKSAAAEKELAEKVLSKGSFQEALGLPEASIEQFYDYAEDLLLEERFEDAAAVLFVLTLLCPDRPSVWISYGINKHHSEEYEMALSAYEHASILAPELVEPYVYAAQCAVRLEKKEVALKYLKQMEEFSKPFEKDKEILDLAKRLKEVLTHG
jgi:tetratricopeptide (TPR) repeat protein